MKEQTDFVEDRFMSGEKMNYRLALLMQISRIGSIPLKVRIKLMGQNDVDSMKIIHISKQIAADTLYDSVLLLEMMLRPYFDEKYTKAREDLDNEEEFKVLDNPAETSDYSRQIFGFLMQLMRRTNLLLQEEGEDVVE